MRPCTRRIFLGLVFAVGWLVSSLAFVPRPRAASATTAINIATFVIDECSVAATALAFGQYDPIGANSVSPRTTTSSITLTCTKRPPWATPIKIGISDGANANSIPGVRRSMKLQSAAIAFLPYALFQDAAMTTEWTAGAGAYSVAQVTSKTPQVFKVFGRIPAAFDAAIGSFLDTVVITITF